MSQVLMHDLQSEDQKGLLYSSKRSQLNIYFQFVKLVVKLRFKKPSFLITQAVCGCLLLLCFLVKPQNNHINPNEQKNVSIKWRSLFSSPYPDEILIYYNTSMGFYPSNQYTNVLADRVRSYSYDAPKDVTVFDSESDYNQFLKKATKTYINFQNPSPNFFNITGGAMYNKDYVYSGELPPKFLDYVIAKAYIYSDILYAKYTDSTHFKPASVFYQLPVFVIIADFAMFFHSFSEFLDYREKKQFLLLVISGAKETTLYLAYFTIDVFISLFHTIIQTIIIHKYSKEASIPFFFFMLLFFNLYQYFLHFIFVILSYIQKYYKTVFIIELMIFSFTPGLFAILNSFEQDLTLIANIYRFFPQGALTLLFDNLMYCFVYETTLSFSTASTKYHFIPTSEVVYISIGMLFVVLFILFFLNLMYPRSSGTPPIGFKNIFKSRYWKKVFLKSKTDTSFKEGFHFIDVNNINKIYSGKVKIHALQDVSFSIDKGEIIILIGPNGSGKSTLLNSMTGSIDCDSGTLKLYGEECAAGFSEMQQCLGICFQENVFFDRFNVREHLNFFALIRGFEKSNLEIEVDRCIDNFGLSDCEHNRAESLSGGQKRKLCIALAFIGSPQFVILDEPTAGIDVTMRQTIWKAISGYGITSLVSTHSLEEAESISNRLFILRNGQMIFDGPSNELRRKYHCGYRLQPMYISDIDKSKANQSLLEFCQRNIPESILDDQHEDSILMPVCKDVVQLLDNLEKRKIEFQMNDFNIIVEQLENVLYRMYVDDENAQNV